MADEREYRGIIVYGGKNVITCGTFYGNREKGKFVNDVARGQVQQALWFDTLQPRSKLVELVGIKE